VFIPGGIVLQCNSVQYNTLQYNTTTHITQHNIQHSNQLSIRKITTTKNQERMLYTVKTQKRVEPKVDESVLKTTWSTKQWVSHTIQYSVSLISPKPAPHYPYVHFTFHPALIPFTSLYLEIPDFPRTSKSSLHLTLSQPAVYTYLIFPQFKIPSFHFTYHISTSFPGNTRFPPHF
jgi:hypothetical protein